MDSHESPFHQHAIMGQNWTSIWPMLHTSSQCWASSGIIQHFYRDCNRAVCVCVGGEEHPQLTHWCRVKHICVDKLTIIGSDNGLSPGWRQAIIWTNYGILLIALIGTICNEIPIKIHTFSSINPFENVVQKMAAILSRPQWVKSFGTDARCAC